VLAGLCAEHLARRSVLTLHPATRAAGT
jgi:hypothetical protein